MSTWGLHEIDFFTPFRWNSDTLPATLLLFATGLDVLGLLARRRKGKNRAAANAVPRDPVQGLRLAFRCHSESKGLVL